MFLYNKLKGSGISPLVLSASSKIGSVITSAKNNTYGCTSWSLS